MTARAWCALAVLLALTCISAHAKTAPNLPEHFSMEWRIYDMVTNSSAYPFVPTPPYKVGTGKTYYDWALPAMIEIYDDFCVNIFPQGNAWRCHFLNVNGTSYLISWGGPYAPCCIFGSPFSPPSPGFLNEAKVPFNRSTELEGRLVDWWVLDGDDPAEPFGYGFVHTTQQIGTPAAFWFRSVSGFTSQLFHNVRLDKPDPSVWTVPDACTNAPSCGFL